jgi:hypothetical protein
MLVGKNIQLHVDNEALIYAWERRLCKQSELVLSNNKCCIFLNLYYHVKSKKKIDSDTGKKGGGGNSEVRVFLCEASS